MARSHTSRARPSRGANRPATARRTAAAKRPVAARRTAAARRPLAKLRAAAAPTRGKATAPRKPTARRKPSARQGPGRRVPAASVGGARKPPASLTFRFHPGDRVQTRTGHPKGHCRTPTYLRGREGVVERCLGHFRNPEQLAYGKPGLPKAALYTVRFPQAQLWAGYPGPRTDSLVADIYEFWLRPA